MVPRNCELVHTAAFEFVYTPQKYAVAVINRWEFFLWLVVNLCALQGFVRTKMSTIPNVIRVRTILYDFFLGGGEILRRSAADFRLQQSHNGTLFFYNVEIRKSPSLVRIESKTKLNNPQQNSTRYIQTQTIPNQTADKLDPSGGCLPVLRAVGRG